MHPPTPKPIRVRSPWRRPSAFVRPSRPPTSRNSSSATSSSSHSVPSSARRSKSSARSNSGDDRRKFSQHHRHNYSQLLILNAGGGYHVLLAGIGSVDLEQFVVTGELVAVMGGGAQSAVAKAGGASQPVLYVEFRKDGVP